MRCGIWVWPLKKASFSTARPELERHRSEEHTSELQSRLHLVCRLLLEKKKKTITTRTACSHRFRSASQLALSSPRRTAGTTCAQSSVSTVMSHCGHDQDTYHRPTGTRI